DRWRSPGRRYLCLEPAGRHSVMPGGIASLAGTHDALCVLQDPEAESDAVVVDDELHQDAGVEQPEVVVRQPKTCCVGTPEVADVLTGGHIPEPGGEEEPLALGGRIVDEADPLVSLPGLSLPADGGLPRVGRVVAEGLTPLEAGPVRAVSVGGVTALCFEAPGRVLEAGEEVGDLVERDQVRHAVLLLRRCVGGRGDEAGHEAGQQLTGIRTNVSEGLTSRSCARCSGVVSRSPCTRISPVS